MQSAMTLPTILRMKALILGGTGWVGHHIALSFANAGHNVTIASRGKKSDYLDEIGTDFRIVQADKTKADQMKPLLAERFDVIADSVPTEASIDIVFEHQKGLRHYLHCSSTGGYAPLPSIPGDETMPYDHFMGGWQQKQIVDAKILHLHTTQGFPATTIRPSYITGPGLIPIDNLGGRRPDFIPDILTGKTIDLPDDGQALLHPVHVADLGDSFRLAAENPQVSVGQIYNACLDKAVTLKRYIEVTADALDRDVTINYLPVDDLWEKYKDVAQERGMRFLATHMCYDISKIKRQLGYKPRMSVEQAIAETACWTANKS